ncbi:hypothetical protein Tco_1313396 [Tanacetum coccineum]
MADNRTMAQMLQAPIEGYEDAIVVPPINANNFELKHTLINLVQSNQFTGLLRQCPHHGFSKLHQLDTFYNSLNTNDQDALDSAAGGIFLDKMPRDGLAIIESKSKVHYSRSRAIEPRVSTNAPLSTSTPFNSFEFQQLAAFFEDKIDIRMSRLEKMISEKNVTTPATVKAIEEVCVTCSSNHNFNNCPLTRNEFPAFHDNIHQFQQTAATGRRCNFVQRILLNLLRTAKALIDLYEETLTLRVGKEELVYYADKSEKNKDKNFVHAISVIDFSKADPFSGSTTNTLPPSSSLMKTSDNFEKFADELAPLDSLPPKKDKDVEIQSSSFFTLTSPEESEFEAYIERDSIPPGIDLTLPPTLEVSSSNPTSPTLTGEKVCSWKTPMFLSLIQFVWKMMKRYSIRKKIICLLATYLHQKPKPLSRPQEVEEIKEKEDKVSSDVPINTIVMPIRITFDNPIDFNDHFSKPKDLKKDLTISLDSTESSILPPPLLDSDSPFTAELSASITLNSLGNEKNHPNKKKKKGN